jgi:hypothetical protein
LYKLIPIIISKMIYYIYLAITGKGTWMVSNKETIHVLK